jgi:tRNA 2-thiouridine synthesizing protein A
MTQKTIDARGLSCPQPVVLAQIAIKEGLSSFNVIVSSEVAKENVLRLLKNNNMKTDLASDGDDTIIKAVK